MNKLSPQLGNTQIVTYPGYGYEFRDDGFRGWRFLFNGIVYQNSPVFNVGERVAIKMLRNVMDVTEEETNTQIFHDRVAPFFVDAEPGRKVVVTLGDRSFPLKKRTRKNGRFRGWLKLSEPLIEQHAVTDANGNRSVRFQMSCDMTSAGPATVTMQLLNTNGLGVISDIDDTIKVSEVTDLKELLANTFLREFRSIQGMAQVYREWASTGADFHYVSSSPWQLFESLMDMKTEDGFPSGTLHLRNFRLRDQFLKKLLFFRREGKSKAIRALLKNLTYRQFVMVGDSGEQDPEIYRKICSKFPGRVKGVFIRELPDRPLEPERIHKLTKVLKNGVFAKFQTPEQLAEVSESIFGQPVAL